MNRRSILQFLGLAPLAAVVPAAAKPDRVTPKTYVVSKGHYYWRGDIKVWRRLPAGQETAIPRGRGWYEVYDDHGHLIAFGCNS
jgi:hypothetical protein